MSIHCTQAAAKDEALPGRELLEFLAEWETGDGQWIDPVELGEPINATPDEKPGEPGKTGTNGPGPGVPNE